MGSEGFLPAVSAQRMSFPFPIPQNQVCVLTGDKLETAINIGYSTRVLRQDQLLLQLTSGSAAEVEAGLVRLFKAIVEKKGMPKAMADVAAASMNQQGSLFGGTFACGKRGSTERVVQAIEVLRKHYPDLPMQRRPSAADAQSTGANGMISRPMRMRNPLNRRRSSVVIRDFAFIMEGPALLHVLGNEALEVLLFETMRACSAVIACRVSPKQKALLVRCVVGFDLFPFLNFVTRLYPRKPRLVKEKVTPEPCTLGIGRCMPAGSRHGLRPQRGLTSSPFLS